MDTEEVMNILLSRGVEVPDGRPSRSQLAKLFVALQESIRDSSRSATPSQPRKRASSRSKIATKAGQSKDEKEEDVARVATPTRPRRKSGTSAVKRAVEEEQEDPEPEKKRRRSSSGRALKTKSSGPVKETEEEEQEKEKEQEE